MKLPNQNPNELAGSEVRPQPPHCDKNSYILESPPFQCCSDNKATESERQPIILATELTDQKPDFIRVTRGSTYPENKFSKGVQCRRSKRARGSRRNRESQSQRSYLSPTIRSERRDLNCKQHWLSPQ